MEKPWTVSRGPIAATELDVRKSEAINAMLVRPIGILPSSPGDQIRPFAIGLFEEIRELLKPDAGVTVLRRAVAAYLHSKRYYFASAQPDSIRYDINGDPLEPMCTDDRLVAQARFLKLKKTNDERGSEVPPPADPPSKNEQIRAGLLRRKGQLATSR